MIEITDKKDCCGCTACVSACPLHCITMYRDEMGFMYPKVDLDICINCRKCERVCPEINEPSQTDMMSVTATNAKDKTSRLASTSGGICHIISENIISRGGVVYGAVFDATTKSVKHIRTSSLKELDQLRGSKYLQSDLTGIFPQVKQSLVEGRKTLFIGTPCQISGLKLFLGKEYDNLYTIDFVCHGVPSQTVFNRYVRDKEKKYHSNVESVAFRAKMPTWRGSKMSFLFANGLKYSKVIYKDLFYRGFVTNLYLRPSCYACKYNSFHSKADITVCDLWGVEYLRPEIDDNSGLNLTMVHTLRGLKMMDEIKCFINETSYNLEDGIKYNPTIKSHPIPHPLNGLYRKYGKFLPVSIGIWACLLTGRFIKLIRKIK